MERPRWMPEYSGWVDHPAVTLSDAIGRPFPDILQDFVLGPVGMTASTFEQTAARKRDENAARGHDDHGIHGSKWHVYSGIGRGRFVTTPTDLARLDRGPEVRSWPVKPCVVQSKVQEMPESRRDCDYGSGFELANRGQVVLHPRR